MMTLRRISALLLCAVSFVASAQLKEFGDGGPGPVKADHLTVELVTLAPDIAPGGTQQLGLVITLEEHWHVYWVNSGDAGEPPTVKWTLPKGITSGPMQFGVPSRLPLGPLMDFGYEWTAVFPFAMTAAPTVKPGPAHLDAHVTWLVCREVCIPGKAHLGIDLNVTPGAKPGALVGALGAAISHLPGPPPATLKFSVLGGKSDFLLTFTGETINNANPEPEFYPFDPDQIQNAADQVVERIPGGFRLRLPRAVDPDHPDTAVVLPATLHGLIKFSDTEAYDVTAPVVPGEFGAASSAVQPVAAAPPSTPPAKSATASTTELSVLSAIGLAFLGGIILNLMPCVFPVLFLRGLALVQTSGEERRHQRQHGLVYTLGILVSFWAIVATLLIVRAGGSHVGWGFQLQSPVFLVFLASGIFFFALSLAGLFDIGLSLTSVGGDLAQKQGYTGSFFTGVLATVVATPCTAPLMGVAIGFALAQPAPVTFAVFTALALGLAAPYLALSFQPAWTRILPRPGAWMETFKHFTALIFFGTVIWLTWVYGRLHTGEPGVESDHLGYLLLCFLVLAIAGWVLGKWPAKWPSTIAAIILIAAGLAIPLTQTRHYVYHVAAASSAASSDIDGNKWQPYSRASLDAARASGHPVFIDFTAAWCLSCQVNEKVILRSPDVEKQFAAHNFTLIRADWTNEDPAITAELDSVHRGGVPTYVLYPAASSAQADVLPELLSKSIVLNAIDRDTK